MVKSLPAMQETWIRSLGQEDPLEMEIATHSSILAWRIPWTEKPGGLQSMGSQNLVDHHGLRSGCLGRRGYPHLPGFWSPSISQAVSSDVTEGGDSQAPTLHHPDG